MGFRSRQVKNWLARHKRSLLATAMLLGTLSILETQLLYRATSEWGWAYTTPKLSSILYALVFILAFLALDLKLSAFSRVVVRLGSVSFGVYLIHSKVLELVSRVVYHLAPQMLGLPLVFVPLLVVMGVGGPWLLIRIVGNSPARRVSRYLFR